MFIFINKILRKPHLITLWSGVEDQKIDCSIISIGAMSHTIQWLPLEGMASTKRNAQAVQQEVKLRGKLR